ALCVWPPASTPVQVNLVQGRRQGVMGAVAGGMRGPAHRTRIRRINNRVVAHPLEVGGALGEYDAGTRLYTIHAPVQGVHRARADAAISLGVPETEVRMVVDDLGGGFGARAYGYPENVAVAWAARRTGRPVKWLADRTELFL